jgi:hypothetical protein
LVLNLLDIPSAEQPRETVALDYKYGEKSQPGKEDKKLPVNSYEVGGGRNLT